MRVAIDSKKDKIADNLLLRLLMVGWNRFHQWEHYLNVLALVETSNRGNLGDTGRSYPRKEICVRPYAEASEFTTIANS